VVNALVRKGIEALKSLAIKAATVLAIATTLGTTPASARSRKAPPAAPAPVVPTPQVTSAVVPLTTKLAIAAFYQSRPATRIWFKPGAGEAVSELVSVLKRAQLDGLAIAPVLAAETEAAVSRAKTGDPAAQAAAEGLLSAGWALYAQALKKPVAGVEFGDATLAPRIPNADQVLLQAKSAPSLQQHIRSIASVNPIYAQLRDAAWTQMQAGGTAVDPRLQANLERARILPASGRFIIVDAATARLWMYEDGRIVDSMKVIVGMRQTPTPMIASTMSYTTLNPYWNIPTDVTKRVVAPLVVKRGTKYLKSARYEVASDWTDAATVVPPDDIDWKAIADGSKEVRIRQLPGATNMMGKYKFGFPNQQGIYLHDTPRKDLFDRARRNNSLGCVRVEDAKRLATWLMGSEPVAPSTDPEQHVRLPKGVPVYITYLTAHADAGQLTFADDVYGLDPTPEPQLAAAPEPTPSVTAAATPPATKIPAATTPDSAAKLPGATKPSSDGL
jgi:murein L,D-transpeptidase YcbB/YkuD